MFNFGKVTAQVDLEYEEWCDNEYGTEVEQAFVAYDLGNGLYITAGRYESMLGLEAKEPTGLYQYSTAYSSSALGGIDGPSSISHKVLRLLHSLVICPMRFLFKMKLSIQRVLAFGDGITAPTV